jgi:hypothetical protein
MGFMVVYVGAILEQDYFRIVTFMALTTTRNFNS